MAKYVCDDCKVVFDVEKQNGIIAVYCPFCFCSRVSRSNKKKSRLVK